MVIHFGIDAVFGGLSYYNEKKRTYHFSIEQVKSTEIERVNLMFDEVKLKISGELGCLCICLFAYYDNEIRKKFIESGLKAGFRNIEIINRETVLYLNAMSQVNYKLLNGEVIWIKWGNLFFVWQITNQKAEFFGRRRADPSKISDLQKIIKESKLNKGPDIVLYDHDNEIDKANFDKISKCHFFSYKISTNWFSKGALLKARIAGNDIGIAHLDTINFLSQEITLTMGQKNIVSYKYGHHLPIFFSQIFSKKEENDLLKIDREFSEAKSFKLPNYEKIYLTFQTDENAIYTVNFKEHPNNEGDEKQLTTNTLPVKLQTTLKSTVLKTPGTPPKNQYAIPKTNNSLNNKFEAVGIDLGTSRCCVAVNRKNGINTVPLDNKGERLLPSFVSYDEKNVKCGRVVVKRLRQFPKSVIFDSKRIIGRSMSNFEIDQFWPFGILEKEGKVYLEIEKFNGKGIVSPEEVASELLKYMKQKTEEFQGKKLFKTVITVPAAFTEAQKVATLEAANLAGWKEVKLLPEPIAAAFAYFVDRPIPNNSNVLLFDLGGGTLDVCIFKVENNQIQIISNTGDSKFGGRDFDTLLINYFKNALLTKYGISLVKNKKYLLMMKCQKIKETLTVMTNANLDIDDFDPHQDGIISISQEEFRKMSEPLLNKVKNTVNAALHNSRLNENLIYKVLLVGGGSRMPMIKELLQEIFPNANHSCEEHPDEVVAIGAAYYAYSIFSES